QNLGDRRGQRRLPVVNVTDGADVDVRLSPLELRLRHWCPPVDFLVRTSGAPCGAQDSVDSRSGPGCAAGKHMGPTAVKLSDPVRCSSSEGESEITPRSPSR